jgi:formate hydrogenlyase subunit 3/multisubunit Na+/H+ antiporter MnhD subunit
MELVLIARNAVLFLVAWEVMALSSFFLVTADDADADTRAAGRTYLVAAHLGMACLVVTFVLLGRGADPLDFARFALPAAPGLVFVLALLGFGTKAGLIPLHVWLPEAHPAAPSHVSALMSAVMIKTGIYGLLRVTTLLGPLPVWCGWLLVAVGAVSGTLGILSALAQQDLKRILAYSSVENVGIVALALGLGLVGLDAGATDVAVFGFAAALFHVLSHAVMKGLLFLGAGAVVQQTGTRRLEALGGLLGRMPRTGAACFVGCAAIAGLPPLNGFAGELLLYAGAYRATGVLGGAHALPALATIAGLALIGGLAAACFAKTFGIAFLGTARTECVRRAEEPPPAMQGAMLLLAAGCVLLGLLAPAAVRTLEPVLVQLTRLPHDVVGGALGEAVVTLRAVVVASGTFVALAAGIAGGRRWLLAGRTVAEAPTWGCGYAAPSARMQYGGSSFGQPLMDVFRVVLPTRTHAALPKGFFPASASFATATPDLARERLYDPVVRGLVRLLASLRWLQHGQVQLYVLYVAATLVGLFFWKIGLR